MKTDFTIRQAQQSDAVELKELFQNTVIVINRRDYSDLCQSNRTYAKCSIE